jgi:hypothetical protein
MAAERRRETMIALRARRTAYRVASDLFLFQHSKPLAIDCSRCRRSFLPVKSETICPNCALAQRSPPVDDLPIYETVLPLTWRDRLKAACVWPTPEEWAMLIVVFSLLGLSLWALVHGGMH